MPVPSLSRSAVLALGLALVGLIACAVTAVGLLREAPVSTPTAPAAFHPATTSAVAPVLSHEPSAVLRSWDAARSQAWARGDPAALRRLYLPGSAAGEHDVAMLRAWRDRGLVVQGLTTQLLEVEPAGSRSARGWALRVTDRVVGGEAVATDGTRTPLPADEASTRLITLRRYDGRWRVVSVAPVSSVSSAASVGGGA